MASKIPFLQESIFRNLSDQPELMIPADERVRVSYDNDRFSYEVHSPAEAMESIVLQPNELVELI